MKAHHTAICCRDVEVGLRFWRDGLGFVVTMDQRFEGDWPTLLGAPASTLRSVFLGDPEDPSGGIVELVDLGPVPAGPAASAHDAPATGFFLISVYCDIQSVLDRLARLGLGGTPRRTTVHGVDMAVVTDPAGVRVELIDLP